MRRKRREPGNFKSAYDLAWEAGTAQTCRLCGDEYDRPMYLVGYPCVPCRDRLEADRGTHWCLCPVCGAQSSESPDHACPFCDGDG
jgi:hypothetical protein